MTRDLSALSARTFDLVVIGGGITGACIAHDAALRGLQVALVEKADFGSATSAASSKLLHGGIRYLQQAQLGKVRESARERAAFVRIAPHLVRWVPFLIPTSHSLSKGRLLLGAGIASYHALCAGTASGIADPERRVPGDRFLSRQRVISQYPLLESIERVTGAWVIHELHMHSSERMTLAFLKSAQTRGAVVANYVEATGLLRDRTGRVVGIAARDQLEGRPFEVGARLVANAAGPWISLFNVAQARAHLEREITAFSKGVHIVTRPLIEGAAVAVPTRHRNQAMIQRGGRHFFIIPWRGRSLIGTTNVPFRRTPDEVGVDREDVRTFVEDINDALPAACLSVSDVEYAFAGLYPLTEDVVRPEVYQGTGLYQLVDHARADGVEGFVSVLGAKYTTARALAQRAVDLVAAKLARRLPQAETAATPLVGGDLADVRTFRADLDDRYGRSLDSVTIDHLAGHYGTDVHAVVALGRQHEAGFAPIARNQPTIEAEVRYAVHAEMAQRLDDVVFRRTGLGTIGHPGAAALARCAAIMAEGLGWSEARARDEVAHVERRFHW
jgi:glycerol-3-phosphate dehydrogenase